MTCISNCLLFLDFERTQTDISSTGCSEKRDGKMRYSYCDPPEEGMALQYSCLENSMDREAWWARVHGVTKSWTRLSDFTFTFSQNHVYSINQLCKHGDQLLALSHCRQEKGMSVVSIMTGTCLC